jgi:choline dehydrogenase-like flavoprotein
VLKKINTVDYKMSVFFCIFYHSIKKSLKMLVKAVKLSISALILSTIISVQLAIATCNDATAENDEFDFIIYGGGSSGSVVARRLSDNPDWKVLLLEIGGEGSAENDIPLNLVRLPQDCTNSFGYKYEPREGYCQAMKNKQCVAQVGKNLGGTSLIGDMIYSRGNRKDYDNLCKQGNHGWCFKDVLPFFKKLENNEIPDHDAKNCGKGGPITISYANYRTKLASVFLKREKSFTIRL